MTYTAAIFMPLHNDEIFALVSADISMTEGEPDFFGRRIPELEVAVESVKYLDANGRTLNTQEIESEYMGREDVIMHAIEYETGAPADHISICH